MPIWYPFRRTLLMQSIVYQEIQGKMGEGTKRILKKALIR